MEKKTVDTEAVKETAKKTATAVKKTAKETADTVKKTAKETSSVAKKAAKDTSTVAKKAAKETGTAVKKTATTVKKTAKKEYTRLALKETYVQVAGNEYKQSDILEKVEAAYIEAGYKITSMKTLQLYIKPEDNAAYYVVNSEITGKVDLQ